MLRRVLGSVASENMRLTNQYDFDPVAQPVIIPRLYAHLSR